MSSDAQTGDDRTGDILTDIPTKWYEALRHPRRIRLLDALRELDAPVALSTLAATIAERECTSGYDEGTYREVRISLVHNHLPRLASFDILEWDGETVEFTQESTPQFGELSGLLDGHEGQDRLLEVLVHPVRMQLYAILRERTYALTVDELATALAARGAGGYAEPERMKVALYHSHLPAMGDVDAIEFDRVSGLVRRSDRSAASVAE
jgi:hypothetical protein